MEVIYAFLFKAWSWVPWVLGLGTIGWIALALLAPGLLSIFSPLLKGAMEALVESVKILWEGLTDILDSWKTLVTVAVILWVFANYWTYKVDHPKRQSLVSQSEVYRTPSTTWSKIKQKVKSNAKTKKKSTENLGATWGWTN